MNIDWIEVLDPSGQQVYEFVIETEAGRLVTGSVWLPQNRSDGELICFGHGASGDRYQFPIVDMANRIRTQSNVVSLSLDGPVHGKRYPGEGHPRDLFMQAFVHGDVIESMVGDWQLAIEAVTKEFKLDLQRMGYCGLSMGTMLGLSLLAKRQDLAVTVLGLAGTSEQFPHGEKMMAAANLIQAPTLFLMHLDDELFSRDLYLTLFDAIASSEKQLHANPGKHDQLALDEIDYMVDFLIRHVKAPAPRQFASIVDG